MHYGYVIGACKSWMESAQRVNDNGKMAALFDRIIARFLGTTDRFYRPTTMPDIGAKLYDIWRGAEGAPR